MKEGSPDHLDIIFQARSHHFGSAEPIRSEIGRFVPNLGFTTFDFVRSAKRNFANKKRELQDYLPRDFCSNLFTSSLVK